MTPTRMLFATLAVLLAAAPGFASDPPLPPATSGSGDAGMKHLLVSLTGTTLAVHTQAPPAAPVTMLSGHGMDYTPAKFDVLEDRYFNAQYGWLPDSFFSLPTDRSIWIERIGATSPATATFQVYEGGNGREGREAWSMNAIYAVDGQAWRWDGEMQHDYYAADLPGDYAMSFRVFVGDSTGNLDLTYTPAETTLNFRVVPEPSTWGLLLLTSLGWFVRRV